MIFEPKLVPISPILSSVRWRFHSRLVMPRIQDTLSAQHPEERLSSWEGQDFIIFHPTPSFLLLRLSSRPVQLRSRDSFLCPASTMERRLHWDHDHSFPGSWGHGSTPGKASWKNLIFLPPPSWHSCFLEWRWPQRETCNIPYIQIHSPGSEIFTWGEKTSLP